MDRAGASLLVRDEVDTVMVESIRAQDEIKLEEYLNELTAPAFDP